MDNRKTVTFVEEDLLQFFGKMALPPWEHASGEMCGGDVDCAPIASEIERWFAANRLEPAANLGCATTNQLLLELLARAETGDYADSIVILLTKLTGDYPGVTIKQMILSLINHANDPNYNYASYRTVDGD